jgi:hypothetical protein
MGNKEDNKNKEHKIKTCYVYSHRGNLDFPHSIKPTGCTGRIKYRNNIIKNPSFIKRSICSLVTRGRVVEPFPRTGEQNDLEFSHRRKLIIFLVIAMTTRAERGGGRQLTSR